MSVVTLWPRARCYSYFLNSDMHHSHHIETSARGDFGQIATSLNAEFLLVQ